MLGADPAGGFEAFAQLLPSPVVAHPQVVGTQAVLDGESRRIAAGQIEFADELGMLRFERRNQRFHTGADGAFLLGIRRMVQFVPEALNGSARGVAPAVEIDNRVAQDSIEPRDDLFIIAHLIDGFQGLEQALLHHIGRQVWVAHPAPREGGEGIEFLEQLIFEFHPLIQWQLRPWRLNRQ